MYTDLTIIRSGLASISICLLFSLLGAAPQAAAQIDNENALVLGIVTSKDGSPIADARVWLVGGDYEAPQLLGETTTNHEGRFSFDDLRDEETVFKNPRALTVWAQHASTGLGWFSGFRQHKRKPVTVKLRPTKTFTGQLVDASGRPFAGTKITPRTLRASRLNKNDNRRGQFSPATIERLTVTTDRDGKFAIEDLPDDGSLFCNIEATGFEKLDVSWNLHQPVITKLNPGLSFSGTVVWPETVSIPDSAGFEFGEVTLRCSSWHLADGTVTTESSQAAYITRKAYSAQIDNQGLFQWNNVAPGKYYISVLFSPQLPLLPSLQSTELLVDSEKEITDFQIDAEKALKITGRVIGALNGEPVAEALIQLMNVVPGGLIPRRRVTTDHDGKYFAYVNQGKYILKIADAPIEYVPSADSFDSEFAKSRLPRLEVNDDIDWPDMEVDPACDVTIQVFDEDGKPAVGANVKVVTMAGFPVGRGDSTAQLTDGNGEYVIRRVAINDTLPICVFTPDAISETNLVITPGDLQGPFQIDLSPDHGFRFRLQVVDQGGEPIAAAKVSLQTYFPFVTKWSEVGSSAISGSAGSGKTDSNGFFETGPLWPDRHYRLSTSAEGYNLSQTPQLKGERGDIVELEPMVLKSIKATKLTGVVVDSNQQPVENVTIYAAGIGYQRATTQTNASGKFELDELATDIRYVFADHADYRLGGARLRANNQPMQITIRSNDSPPKGIRENRLPTRDEQLQFARELIEKAWSLPINPRSSARIALLEAMTEIDSQQAANMSATNGGVFDSVVRAEQATQVINEDADFALRLLKTIGKRRGMMTARALGLRLAQSSDATDKKTAMRLAELALSLADDGTRYYPGLAVLFTKLGAHEQAQTLIASTLKTIDLDNLIEGQQGLVNQLAVAIAPYDYEQARSLASMSDEGFRRTYALADVAYAIVSTDPEKAIREIEALTGDLNARNIRDKTRFRAADAILSKDPKLAIDLVYRCEDAGNKAQAIGRLAVQVAKFDQPQAWEMIDSALAIHRDHPNAFRGYGGAGPFAAALAYQAQLTGYPDMESVIWHVRAACRANGEIGQERLAATIKTARILALVDKLAARDLLNACSESEGQIPRREGGLSLYDQWLQAWLLVDLGRGAKLLGDELDELKAGGKPDPLRYGHGDVFRLLVKSPDERFQLLINDTGLWRWND